jgi:hypothetical protein
MAQAGASGGMVREGTISRSAPVKTGGRNTKAINRTVGYAACILALSPRFAGRGRARQTAG